MPIPRPPALTEGYRHNFDTLKRAWRQGDVALVSAVRKAEPSPRSPGLRHATERRQHHHAGAFCSDVRGQPIRGF